MWLHRFAMLVSASTLALIAAGGLVTSTDSGLAVPDWPTTYGRAMFAFPFSQMVGGIFYEHGHRLIATTVGALTIVLAGWVWLTDSRRWMRRLGFIALAAVVAQGVLGGVTVLFFLPAPVSIAHAALAQIFFCLTLSLALFTSPAWHQGYGMAWLKPCPTGDFAGLKGCAAEVTPAWQGFSLGVHDRRLRHIASIATGLTFLQILLGATMRHTGAGLAIPDFPLAFGRLIPPAWTGSIALHYAHRIGALIVTLAVLTTVAHLRRHHPGRRELMRPALTAAGLAMVQVALGGLTVLSGKAVGVNTTHVVSGALLLGALLVLTLRAFRESFTFEAGSMPVERPRETTLGTRSSVGARA